MPFFTGNASFQGHQMVQMLIKNSSIHSTALDMNLRPITSVKNPIHPQDAATRWYVDSKIDEFSNTLENPYSGYLVTLSGTEPTDITNLRTGSYMVTVTPQEDGYPTALFAISKGSVYSEGHICKVTGVSGEYTPEQLELIWPPGNVLQLKKTGPGFDGEYIVDMNMKNTSDIANPPEIPTDICDKAYVDRCIREQLDIRFGGRVVSLKETEVTKVMNLRCGSYMIAITPLQMDGAPTACFTVSKNSASASASIMRTSSCVGLSPYSEQLNLTWPENSMLLLAKTGPGYDGQYLVDMNLKNFSSVPEALIPSDAATCAYVDSQIERRMEAKFSGNIVRLVDTLLQNVENLRPGSYVIAVTSLVYGGPSATFALSKNSPFVDASIMRTSSCPGLETGEILEVIWAENKMLALRKTGPFYDGDYLVDYNLKNISPTPTVPVFPDDQASKDYVDHQIKASLELELEGVTVNLEDTAFAQVCALRYGSYLIAVTALVYGGATATFAVSKSSSGGQPSICRITSCPATDTGEQLEVIWPENSKIMLRKTGPMHDGAYVFDMNLKNFTGAAPSVITTDIATRDFVHEMIERRMFTHFSGYEVFLQDDTFVPVAALNPGSYVLAVTSKVVQGPTTTFAVSKSSLDGEASVVKITSCPGREGEQLELIWPANAKLQIRKTGRYCTGRYIIDMTLKNVSTEMGPPYMSQDLMRELFQEELEKRMREHFSGIDVDLNDTNLSPVATLTPGSYVIAVTSKVLNGPTATFAVSKSSSEGEASVTKLTSCPGVEGEQLEVYWPGNAKLQLRKTSVASNGRYVVDMNMKNIIGPETMNITPNDTIVEDLIAQQIELRMKEHLSGIEVLLVGTDRVAVGALQPGSYLIAVTAKVRNGPTTTFAVSKSSLDGEASVTKLTSCPGEYGEQLEMYWPASERLQLCKNSLTCDGKYLVDFNLKNLVGPPSMALVGSTTETLIHDAISEQFDQRMKEYFGGIDVTLSDTEFATVAALNPGSYVIAVTARVLNGPTTTFAVSKSSVEGEASVVKMTSCPGLRGEQLELFWAADSKLMLRKTGVGSNGVYTVELNLKSVTSAAPPPTAPLSKTAIEEIFHEQVAIQLKEYFSGIEVPLVDDQFTSVAALHPGSYLIAVTSKVPEGPTTTFALSKSSYDGEASVVKMTACPGVHGEQLELQWPAGSRLQLRKTGVAYNGVYVVDLNLKNIAGPPALMPHNLDNLDNSVVVAQVNEYLKDKLQIIEVSLLNDEVAHLQAISPGSCLVSVTSRVDGGPTATFVVSKATIDSEASIVRLSSYPSEDGQQIDFSWPGGERPQIRKSGPGFDGTYLVDINHKQLVQLHPSIPNIPNIPNISNTTSIRLDKRLVTSIPTPLKGSFTLHVSPVEDGPAACFLVSRSNINRECSQYMVTSTSGDPALDDEITTKLVLSWPLGEAMTLNKTTDCFDGMYEIKLF